MALTWSFRCATWGVVASLVALVLFQHCLSSAPPIAQRIAAGSVAIVLGISSLVAFHISSLRCSESHTLKSLLASYVMNEGERLATPWLAAKLDRMWRHPRKVQEDLLQELTRRQARTEYGRQHRLHEIRSLEDLGKKHPLTDYEHFREYIRRMADGEEGVFLGEKAVRFGVTSGTTGAGKLVPFGDHYLSEDVLIRKLNRLTLYQGNSRPSSIQKSCYIYTNPKLSFTKCGTPIGPYSYLNEKSPPIATFSSPPLAFTLHDDVAVTYIHMLFAIADRNLSILISFFSPYLYRAMCALEANWREMLEDLSAGRINPKISLAPDVRRSLEKHLSPDQARITQLRREFERGFDGITRRIWPHLIAVQAIDVLGFRKQLQDKYNKGVPFCSYIYGSTEVGITGVNLWMDEDTARYVLLPQTAVYEFIPEEHSGEIDPKTLLIDEVEIGRRYELVCTTRSGLCRYRNGDVIQIVGFQVKCPIFSFLYRTGEYLNLVYEKINTRATSAAVNSIIERCRGLRLINWTCAESPTYHPGNTELYYMLFIEVDPGEEKLALTDAQRAKFDEHLRQSQFIYNTLRSSSTISQPQVHLVRPGTFGELRQFTVANTTTSLNQYKTPRKLRTRDQIVWMMERVIPGQES